MRGRSIQNLDLAAIAVAAAWPLNGDLASTEHDLAGRGAVPVPDPPTRWQLGVLLTDDREEEGAGAGASAVDDGVIEDLTRPPAQDLAARPFA